MLLDRAFHLMLLAVEFYIDKRVKQTNLLDASRGDDALVVHIIQGILDRRTAAV